MTLLEQSRKWFPTQQEDEQIYLVLREHWVRLVLKLLAWLVFLFALFLFNKYVPQILPGLFQGGAEKVTLLFAQVYRMFLLLTLFLIWIFYYLNVLIITDRSIVDITQVGLFSHTVSELHLENIEDVTTQTSGIFATLFNYGDILIQTAGAVEKFEAYNLPNPSEVEKLILDLYGRLPHHNIHPNK